MTHREVLKEQNYCYLFIFIMFYYIQALRLISNLSKLTFSSFIRCIDTFKTVFLCMLDYLKKMFTFVKRYIRRDDYFSYKVMSTWYA